MIKLFEMFAGYGGASFSLKKIGFPFECVGYSEIDKYAIQCFEQNHKGVKNYGDCTKINPNEIPDFDLLTGGFPCQSFSVAGKGLGELDPRGTLFYDIIRIAEVKKPKYMLLENVKGLTNKNHKETFNKILSELRRIGYDVIWKVLNSKHYGIPQNRERVFFVCFRKDLEGNFKFPEKEELRIVLNDLLEEEVDKKYYLSELAIERLRKRCNLVKEDGTIGTILSTNYKCNWNTPLIFDKSSKKSTEEFYIVNEENNLSRPSYLQFQNGNHSEAHRYYNSNGIIQTIKKVPLKIIDCYNKKIKEDICPTLTEPHHNNLRLIMHSLYPRSGNPKQGGTGHLTKEDGTSYCLDTGNMQAIEKEMIIRKLTPKECFRLMGFLNDEINLDGLSDTQKYKLAGNGWDINLVSKIFKEMFIQMKGGKEQNGSTNRT